MAAPSYEALGILNLLFLLIGVLILLAVNTYVVWQWRHPEDRNEWFSAKLIVVLSMLASELVIIGLPLDVSNNQGSRDCMIPASRGAAAPPRHRRASSLGKEVVGGFFFDFEAVRTESRDRDAPRRFLGGRRLREVRRFGHAGLLGRGELAADGLCLMLITWFFIRL